MRSALLLVLVASQWVACARETPAAAASEREGPAPRSVLVTGFHDWRELGDPPNVWRCRENPSCRLLLGAPREDRPTAHDGPLARHLRREAPHVAWTFRTMTTEWGAFAQVPREHDVIVNLGLGVYDSAAHLQLERGAYNLRRGRDAAGVERSGEIEPGAGAVREAPPVVQARIDELEGRRFGAFEIRVDHAREDNSFLCNETHWYALGASGERPSAVYFVHIPSPADRDQGPLARAVGDLVLELAR